MTNARPADDTVMAATKCGDVIALPWGIEFRDPTCHECQKRLDHRRRYPNPTAPRP